MLHSRRRTGVAKTHRAVDHIEACLPLVQPQLVVGRLVGVGEIDGSPLDVEDSIRRTAGHRCENTADSARETRAAGLCICALVVPVWEDGVVVGEPRRRARINPEAICGREVGIPVGRHIDASEGLVVQGVREGQRNGGYLIISMIADVRRAWLDTAAYLRYVVMVMRRATLYGVAPSECLVRIAERIADRPRDDIRHQVPPKLDTQCEPGRHVSVDHGDSRHSGANITGQHQIGGLNRGRINRLAPVHVILICVRRRRGERPANRRIGRSHL